jgi:hypothetical protein
MRLSPPGRQLAPWPAACRERGTARASVILAFSRGMCRFRCIFEASSLDQLAGALIVLLGDCAAVRRPIYVAEPTQTYEVPRHCVVRRFEFCPCHAQSPSVTIAATADPPSSWAIARLPLVNARNEAQVQSSTTHSVPGA